MINKSFHMNKVDLNAQVVGPGPLAPGVSGIVVGADVPFQEARRALNLAHDSGFSKVYMIRSPGARQ